MYLGRPTWDKGGGLQPPPFVVSFVLALNTGHILLLRRKTCALLRAKTSALLRRKTCAVLRARTCALFRLTLLSPGSDCRRGAKWVQNLVFRTRLSNKSQKNIERERSKVTKYCYLHQLRAILNSLPDPPDLHDLVSETAARTLPSTRAGGQDDGS